MLSKATDKNGLINIVSRSSCRSVSNTSVSFKIKSSRIHPWTDSLEGWVEIFLIIIPVICYLLLLSLTKYPRYSHAFCKYLQSQRLDSWMATASSYVLGCWKDLGCWSHHHDRFS